MEFHKELYESLKKGALQESLYYTGVLLVNEELEILIYTWIRIIAFIGEFSQLYFLKWVNTCKDIVSILECPEIDVVFMFQITTKICILFQNANQYISLSKKPIQSLRTNVLDIFSEKVRLSEAGRLKFMSILPKPLNEHEFCLKILGGIISLWTKKEALRLREAFEYLYRKDYILDSLVSETDNNVVSFLWDFLKMYQPEYTQYVYPLYKYHYKKKDKTWRAGLLYAFHNILYDPLIHVSWNENEKQILKHIHDITEDLWTHVRETIIEEAPTSDMEDVDKMYYFENFFPRTKQDIEEIPPVAPLDRIPIRSITVKNKKGSKKIERELSKEKENIYNNNYLY